MSLCCGAALVIGAGSAAAQAALDDDESSPPPEPPTASAEDPNATMIGAGLRLRSVHVPQGLVELFVERAAGSSSEFGFGIEVARRKGNFEVQFGLEYDKIFIQDGLWIDKGDMLPQDEPDFVEFDGFGWITAEVTFLNHTPITKQFAVRYGGGAGIGIIRGEVRRTDYRCATADLESCSESPAAENIRNPYDIPPVMLVVNAIVGVQIRPIDKLFINVEGGLRTLPFFGATVGYYF
jgi:hypothetical protein